jgi:glycosyltransferase involved in cell wall biosynthesis
MRVTHVITRLIVGGAQENTIASVLGFQSKPGWEVDLVSGPTLGPEGTLEPVFDPWPGVLSIEPHLVRPVRPGRDFRAYRALQRRFKSTRPTIVHTHSGKAGIVGRLAARHAGVPIVVHTIHGPSFGPWQSGLSNFIFRAAERMAGRATTHFIVVAEAMTRQYLEAGIGQPGDYTRVFSGFDLQRFLEARPDAARRQRLGLAPDDLVIGKIARLFELKGHDDLFAVAPRLVAACPRIKFLLVGGGPWEARFKARAGELGLAKHFVFTGLVPPTEIPGLVGIMDMLVHLSRREGLPRALPQALAAGKPVVAFDCDGAGEVCRTGETGVLVPPGDLDGLAEAVLSLATNEALRQECGARGRAFVSARFPVERMVEEIRLVYAKLLAKKGRPVPEV